MADVKIKHGSATSLTISGLDSLASGSKATSNEINVTTNDPLDVLVELMLDPGTTSGNKQAVVYAVSTLDGTNYSDSTNDDNMRLLGVMALPDTNIVRSAAMSVALAFGGTLPPRFKVVVLNDSGAAFNSSGNAAQYVEVGAEVV